MLYKMRSVAIILLLASSLVVRGQSTIRPRELQVTVNKTTNLIFPAAIVSVDRGSEIIVVQKSTANILRVKADSVFCDTTNLTVITTDGKLYSFLVSYAGSPATLNLDLGTGEMTNRDTALATIVNKVLQTPNDLHGVRYNSGNVKFSVTGIYTNGEVLACKLRIENASTLSYGVSRLIFTVVQNHISKRGAVQESEVMPLLVLPTRTLIQEKQSSVFVAILPKVALGIDQALQIILKEKDGERHLFLRIPHRYIINATLIR